MSTIIRARVAFTPRNQFVSDGAPQVFEDGGFAFADGRVLGCGPFGDVLSGHPEAEILDARDTIRLPGFVDCPVLLGDLSAGKSAGFVLVRSQEGSTLAAVLEQSSSLEAGLGALFTPAREDSIAEVRVAGRVLA